MEGPLYVLELPTNHDPEMVFHACELGHGLREEAENELCNACDKMHGALKVSDETMYGELWNAANDAVGNATQAYELLRKEREEEEERMVQGCIMCIDKAKEFPHIAMYATIAHVHYRMMSNQSRARTRYLYFNR
jgi:hypothetical protein